MEIAATGSGGDGGVHPPERGESLALAPMPKARPSGASETAAFLSRNAVDSLPEGELERKLERAAGEGRPLRVKLGIDPTAPDIHLGHVVVLEKLREFQDAGHTVVLIIGDYTARVGDPSGQSALRPMLEPEQIDRNAATFQDQAFKVIDPRRTEIRRNGEWLDMSMDELLALVRRVTVARVLERDDFQQRIEERPADLTAGDAVPGAPGLRLGGGRVGPGDGGHRPEVQPALRP